MKQPEPSGKICVQDICRRWQESQAREKAARDAILKELTKRLDESWLDAANKAYGTNYPNWEAVADPPKTITGPDGTEWVNVAPGAGWIECPKPAQDPEWSPLADSYAKIGELRVENRRLEAEVALWKKEASRLQVALANAGQNPFKHD